MKFLLDANAVIALLKGHDTFLGHLRQHRPQDFGVPAIVAHELFYGAYRSHHVTMNLARLDSLQFEIVDFTSEDARQAGQIRAKLNAAEKPIGPYDVLIAGQALARNFILITHNTSEFLRIQGLQVEDWEVA